MLQQLQSTVEGLQVPSTPCTCSALDAWQTSLAAAMEGTTGKMAASVQMMESMNSLMEEYLCRSLLIGVISGTKPLDSGDHLCRDHYLELTGGPWAVCDVEAA